MRRGGANLSSATLILPSFDILFYILGYPPSLRVPLCPLLNVSSLLFLLFLCFLTIVWGAVPLLSLSVFLALFHQPVVHRPIFHPASPPSVSCRLSAFYFPCSCISVSHLPVWQLHPPFLFFLSFSQTDRAVSWCSDIAEVNQSGLGGTTGWIVYCHLSSS